MSAPQSPSQSKHAHRHDHKRRISQIPSPEANTRRPGQPSTVKGDYDLAPPLAKLPMMSVLLGTIPKPQILNGVRPVAKNASNDRTSFGATSAFHHLDETSTKPATAVRPRTGEKKVEEEDEDEDEEDRASAPDSQTRHAIPGAGNRRTPSSSSTERQDQSQSPCTQDAEEATTGLGGPTTDTHPDSDLDDAGYAGSNRSSRSFATTVESEVYHEIEENGRLYPNFGKHEYGLPMDKPEQERMAVQHRKFYLLLDAQYFLAPIGDEPQKILDLATGKGHWAVDVAEKFPSARVIGVDVAAIQPRRVPPNCEFEIADVEGRWRWARNSFDFIHMRDPLFVVRDWEKLVDHCFEYLKPGGWCELAGTYPAPASDDDSMPDSSDFRWVCEMMIEASKAFGAPADCPLYFADHLRQAGFANVTERTFQVPSCPWSDDERQREIGRLEQINLRAGASGLGLRVFRDAFGWTQAETEGAMVGFRKDSAQQGYRQYCPHFVAYGQKPPNKLES